MIAEGEWSSPLTVSGETFMRRSRLGIVLAPLFVGVSTSLWAQVEEEALDESVVKSWFSELLQTGSFLDIAYWQWLSLLVAIFLGVAADFTSRLILRPLIRRLVRRFIGEPTPRTVRLAVRPMGLSISALVFLGLLPLIAFSETPDTILSVAGRLVLVVSTVWAAWAVTDLVSSVFIEEAKHTTTTFDNMVIPLVRKSLKLFIVALGLIYIAESLDVALLPLVASFSLAGVAVSFSAQDMVKNLFGGLTIFLDQPFRLGERINFKGFDGTVEQIGFRSTRVRTSTGHVVTIPNANFTSEAVENIGRRPTLRRTLNVTITYDTPREKIEQAVEILRGILDEEGLREPIRPVINGDELLPRVYFNEFNAESLNILVIYWYAPPAYWDYLDHAQRLNLRIFEEFEKAGIDFAFPTRTLHLAGDPKRELAVRCLKDDVDGTTATGRI
jgi:MscS family membrane protein